MRACIGRVAAYYSPASCLFLPTLFSRSTFPTAMSQCIIRRMCQNRSHASHDSRIIGSSAHH